MFRLLPREENFFDLFEQQAGHIVSASRVLEELTLNYPSAQAKVQQIRDLEHAGDTIALVKPLSQVDEAAVKAAEGPVRIVGPGCSASAARTADPLAGDGLLGWHGRILASRPRHCQTRAGR